MGRPRPAPPVTLFAALLSADADLLRRARQKLVHRYGPVHLESNIWPFDETEHYSAEMGTGLKRQCLAFQNLVRPETLPEIKCESGRLEREIAEDCAVLFDVPRPVNIDPGYLDLGKLVLATTRDRAHRVYLDQGIYAETTLQFTDGVWQPWPWTPPDYQKPECHSFLTLVRDHLREQRRVADAAADALDREDRG